MIFFYKMQSQRFVLRLSCFADCACGGGMARWWVAPWQARVVVCQPLQQWYALPGCTVKVHLFLDGQLRAAEDAAQSVLRDCAGETVSQDLHASVRSIITIISRPTPQVVNVYELHLIIRGLLCPPLAARTRPVPFTACQNSLALDGNYGEASNSAADGYMPAKLLKARPSGPPQY